MGVGGGGAWAVKLPVIRAGATALGKLTEIKFEGQLGAILGKFIYSINY